MSVSDKATYMCRLAFTHDSVCQHLVKNDYLIWADNAPPMSHRSSNKDPGSTPEKPPSPPFELFVRAVQRLPKHYKLLLFSLISPRYGRKVPISEDTIYIRLRALRPLSWN